MKHNQKVERVIELAGELTKLQQREEEIKIEIEVLMGRKPASALSKRAAREAAGLPAKRKSGSGKKTRKRRGQGKGYGGRGARFKTKEERDVAVLKALRKFTKRGGAALKEIHNEMGWHSTNALRDAIASLRTQGLVKAAEFTRKRPYPGGKPRIVPCKGWIAVPKSKRKRVTNGASTHA